jgi:hypothetical protein
MDSEAYKATDVPGMEGSPARAAVQVFEGDGKDHEANKVIDRTPAMRELRERLGALEKMLDERNQKATLAGIAMGRPSWWENLRNQVAQSPGFTLAMFYSVVALVGFFVAWNLGGPWSDVRLCVAVPCLLMALFYLGRYRG